MITRLASPSARQFVSWLTLGLLASVAVLVWFGYRAVVEWRRSAASLAERRASETVDLFATSVTRDMRGVQKSVLSSPRWDQFMKDPPYDVLPLVVSAFARFPYPESFFAWRAGREPAPLVFFNRAGRRPAFMPGGSEPTAFPVAVAYQETVAAALFNRIRRDVPRRRQFSVFEMPIGGAPHQVVARLLSEDGHPDRLEGVFGFTVNLAWTRTHYFPELTGQVERILSARGNPSLAVLDGEGKRVAGSGSSAAGRTIRRSFEILFIDPLLVTMDPPEDVSRVPWAVEVDVSADPTFSAAMSVAGRTLGVAAFAAVMLAMGLVLTVRAARTSAKLGEMRSEFVASVTHELKTPIAAIRAIGDTLVSGRISDSRSRHEYAVLVVQEAKRLTRLVDNLLAYARITDVAEVYSFEPLDLGASVIDVVEEFRTQLDEKDFELHLDIPTDLPPARGDRTAIHLLLDNLFDNAIRYSKDTRRLQIRAGSQGDAVFVEVSDRGVGIPADEIDHVTRKFFRGRAATTGGSGLGLAIARRIAIDHGGDLEISSSLGSGTTVRVTLKAAETMR